MDDQATNRESGGIRFRKLRIAFSAMCGILCVLLIALWMRSYRVIDDVHIHWAGSASIFQVRPINGRISLILRRGGGQAFWLAHESTPMFDETKWPGYLDDSGRPPRNDWFYFRRWGLNGTDFGVPFWAPTLLCVTIGAVLCFPWVKRFSLRTLLIVVTVVALVLGAAAYLSQR